MRRLTVLAFLLALGACAAQPPAASGPGRKFVVFFGEWSAAIDQPSLAIINAAATAAKQAPGLPVIVVGYADPTGSPDANIFMSRTRAQVVRDQLVQDGVPAARIQRTGRGPTDFTSTAQESRRVEIDVGG